ncbi:MAG: sulfite exporter TauE/SafE family protein [Firmicutes bacterium]|nr:sulfite exporter TauE/SafE family protein [Bacillota bacterium]
MASGILALMGIAFVAGFFGSMAGLGGGIFIVPALTLLYHYPMRYAVAASLAAVVGTSVSGSLHFLQAGQSNLRLALFLEVLTTLGAMGGGVAAAWLPERALVILFSGVMFYTAWTMVRKATRGRAAPPQGTAPQQAAQASQAALDPPSDPPSPWAASLRGSYYDPALQGQVAYQGHHLAAGLAASVVGGMVSGLLGIGGGVIKVPVMNVIMGLPLKAATATSTFMVGITAAASAFVYFANGYLNPYLAAPVVLGAVAGARVGSAVGRRASSVALTWVFVVLLAFIAIQMLAGRG